MVVVYKDKTQATKCTCGLSNKKSLVVSNKKYSSFKTNPVYIGTSSKISGNCVVKPSKEKKYYLDEEK